jgi:hypothetical protein
MKFNQLSSVPLNPIESICSKLILGNYRISNCWSNRKEKFQYLTREIEQVKCALLQNFRGKFVPALNALIDYGVELKQKYILFSSMEVTASKSCVDALYKELNNPSRSYLVSGARLEGQDFKVDNNNQSAKVALNGLTTPWNTLAIWNLSALARTKFLDISEGNDKICGGVEEVAVIAKQQAEYNDYNEAAVVDSCEGGVDWATKFQDERRKAWHEVKMKSKLQRAETQLQALQLDKTDPTVYHIAK